MDAIGIEHTLPAADMDATDIERTLPAAVLNQIKTQTLLLSFIHKHLFQIKLIIDAYYNIFIKVSSIFTAITSWS